MGERFGCSATDSVHQQAVRGGCMRRSPGDGSVRSNSSTRTARSMYRPPEAPLWPLGPWLLWRASVWLKRADSGFFAEAQRSNRCRRTGRLGWPVRGACATRRRSEGTCEHAKGFRMVREDRILEDALAIAVPEPEVELRGGVAGKAAEGGAGGADERSGSGRAERGPRGGGAGDRRDRSAAEGDL